jgi:hypothetical protein
MSEYVEVWSRKWMRPRVTIYKAAIRQWRFIWNRYNEIPGLDPGVTLGVAAVIGVWVVGIRWARPVVERHATS